MFLGMMLANKKKTGSKAVEEALAGFEGIIQNLNKALIESEEELTEAQALIGQAQMHRDHINGINIKGTKFINGLLTLLKG